MSRGTSALARLVALLVLWLAAFACGSQRPPSIVLVTIDTARADAFGAYGGKASTPTLDQLAREGVQFTRASTPVPITHPAHASLLTGLYPARHGVRDNGLFTLDDSAQTLAETLQTRGYDTAAFVSAVVLTRAFGLAQGFALYDDSGLSGAHLERTARETIDAATRHLRARRADHPFFCWVHLYDPHYPYQPPEPFATQFKEQPYLGEVSYADAELARLVAAARAVDPSTVFVVTADHGEGLGEHGEATHGIFLYQSTVHVPLVIAGGSLPRGQRCDHQVSLLDLAPTLCEIGDAPPLAQSDGRSLVREMNGAEAPDQPLALETMLPYLSYGWSALHALVQEQAKVIAAPRPELYDLATDPRENHNLASERAEQLALGLRAIEARRSSLVPLNAKPYAASQQAMAGLGYVSTPRAINGHETAGADPKDMVPLLDLEAQAQWLMQRAEFESARVILAKIIAVNPDNAIVNEMLGTCLTRLGQYQQGRAVLEQVLKQRPDRAMTAFHLALCHEMTGAIERARDLYVMAIKLDDRYAPAHLRLANILWSQGDTTQARTHYQQYLALDPEDPEREAAVRNRLSGP